tara:strand:- start:116 stop:442 length:327 start_codon:yes stop_codon:yes gene_type:complete
MPKELEENLMSVEWPPLLKIGQGDETQEIKLTELDVNWALCSLLGMRWADAKAVDDPLERRFLYNKAMDIVAQQATQKDELEEQRERMEKKIDDQLSEISANLKPPNL